MAEEEEEELYKGKNDGKKAAKLAPGTKERNNRTTFVCLSVLLRI